MTISVLITRPEPAGLVLADQLRNRWGCGIEVIVSPVMRIVWRDVALDLSDVKSLIFTSGNGLQAYMRVSDRRDLPCYLVGSSTADFAGRNGFSVLRSFDHVSGLLAELQNNPPATPCLHVRGEHVTSNLVSHLSAAGLTAREVVLYDQSQMTLSQSAQECINRGTPVILPLYSPRSAKLLFSQVQPTKSLLVGAISNNVARNVPKGVVNSLLVADQPNAAGMMNVMDALFEQAKRLEGANRAQ